MRAIYVHITQAHVTQSISIVKGSAHGLARDFCRTVEVAIVERMVFRHGNLRSISVDTCGTRVDQTLDIVIDAGFHPEKCGDIDLDQMDKISSAYTPVPGGVGPMTINTLILHTVQSAKKILNN